ncbi:Retrovirus-related Pol polyprotein from type-2 retrotransposable element R2DM [Astathelohania contejeani]|uniref:Retrovirus-related Pol polyprotein from type-2 retrotransposable element R2DM n=1 Tax=Astathelohania contejeani TaxID=164912 RepID=A0ABQ7HWG7_9MICR|nr:Retrovirus-related Pol polyprotein from type-2 retrotransposable element R2DM [Thelohania contejeani]
MQLEVERRGLLADNQLGTVRRVQGAKEQVMLNLSLNKEHGHLLKSTWIDVKKAFDSIDHKYLVDCISKLGFPKWICCFVKKLTSKWSLDVRAGPQRIVNKRVKKGILQGDSLSPLLFVLCIDPLSRRLNERYPNVSIHAEKISHATNHLLFIDDLKLLATNSTVMGNMVKETESFFKAIGLEIKREKSATNDSQCEKTATLLDGTGVYKYLGIIEEYSSNIMRESFEKVRRKLLARVNRLCESNLNSKNLFKAINEHAISLVNYHIKLQQLKPADFLKLDHEIR